MKPILFNTDMVRAILDGRKTVTRRIIKGQDKKTMFDGNFFAAGLYDKETMKRVIEPPYKEGEVLYIRETWRKITDTEYGYRADCHKADDNVFSWKPSIHMPKEAARLFLRITNVRAAKLQDMGLEDYLKEGIYIKNYEVTLSGSNQFLTIPEREKAMEHKREAVARDKFVELWNSTAGKPNSPERIANNWYANPFVWVIEFEVITDEELKA
ncbi:MAG: hypothetical protein IJV71_05810 [Lachnospiraceae bacterium]|nr:hypothetical protein [Lachnospiraceae bacterium]